MPRGAAQKQGLVHRDIKPSNVMFVREEGGDIAVKVIDFGLATSGFLGTPHFASPEQLEEREIDVRSDIYSLGVTLWYMLAWQDAVQRINRSSHKPAPPS